MLDCELKDRSTICSEHFRREDFYFTKGGLRKIKDGAVPPIVGVDETQQDLDAPAAMHVCRVCLSIGYKIYNMKNYRLDLLYHELIGSYDEDSKLPQNLCWECAHRLSTFQRFRNKALRSSSLLSELLHGDKQITLRDILSIDRVEKKLKSGLMEVMIESKSDIVVIEEVSVKNKDEKEQEILEPNSEEDENIPAEEDNVQNSNFTPELQIKDENTSDITYYETLDDFDDTEDDKALNEGYNDYKKPKNSSGKRMEVEEKEDITYYEILDDFDDSEDDKALNEGHNDYEKPKNSSGKRMDVEEKGDIIFYEILDDSDNDKALNEGYNDYEKPKNSSGKRMEVEGEEDITYYESLDDFDDSEDDKALNEGYNDYEKPKNSSGKRMKVEKKEKEKFKRKEEPTPTEVMNRCKTTNVKRKKPRFVNENLFTTVKLTYEEQIAEIEKRKETDKYRNSPLKCTVCYTGFLSRQHYDAHLQKHSDSYGAYECFICKTRMKSSLALRKHLTALHTEKYICKKCEFSSRNRGAAKRHEQWHAGTIYRCSRCSCSFDQLTSYMNHKRIKHVLEFVCELCGFTFVSEKGVIVHKYRKHYLIKEPVQLEGPYCSICDVKFLSDVAHERHLRLSSKHSTDSDMIGIRNDSQNVPTNSSRIRTHGLDSWTHEHSEPITCELCGVVLGNQRRYAHHCRLKHPDKYRALLTKDCMCEHCGKMFATMALLTDHMYTHAEEKQFKCDHCPKIFTNKTRLNVHERVHSATRPMYECPICGKQYTLCSNRTRHMLVHTGLKPFKCDTCGKCFKTLGEQRAHVEHVHLKKPWPKRIHIRTAKRKDTSSRASADQSSSEE